MKKLLTVLFALLGFCVSSWAEQMNFVTTLSSPMGTFSVLETADSSFVTTAPIVNFCTTKAPVGTVLVNGANAYLQVLNLKNGTTLGGNTPEYRVSGALNSLNGGKITGGRLMASGVTVENSTDPKSKVDQKLYLASGKVKGARTDSLTIPGKVQTAANGDGTTGTDLHWSNVYGRDYSCSGSSCSETGSSYTTYLIKSVGASAPTADCSDYSYKIDHKSECCPKVSQSDSDCYYTYRSYKWENTADGFTMADKFGSNWISQACEVNCWRGNPGMNCAKGGELFDGVFSASDVVVKGSQQYSNHTCNATVCDQGWYQSYTCSSSTKGMRFIHLYGYLGGPQGTTYLAHCPPKGSGQSPSWAGSMNAYTCKETERVEKNGW